MIDLDVVRKTFEKEVNTDLVGVPIQYENVNEAKGLVRAKKEKSAWARLVIREGEGVTSSLGSRAVRMISGAAILSLFYPQGKGTKNMRDAASNVMNSVVKLSVPSLVVRTPTFTMVGKTDDWFQGNLVIPFVAKQVA